MSKDTIEPNQFMGYVSFNLRLFGFIASIVLTLLAYFIIENVSKSLAAHWTVAVLGLAQAWIQLVIFLHLGREAKPRWNLIVFLFTLMVTFILVFGSLWIMTNLNYQIMPND